jgi:hypothetical protein
VKRQWKLVAQGAFRIRNLGVGLIPRLFRRRRASRSAGLVSPKTNLECVEGRRTPVIALVDTTQMGV